MFSIANLAPLGALIYYFKNSIDKRRAELEDIAHLSQGTASEIGEKINSLCRMSTQVLLIIGQEIVPCMPHLPEPSRIILTEDDVVANVDKSIPGTADVFDAITARHDSSNQIPLRYIHFGVSPHSNVGKRIAGKQDRGMSMVYSCGSSADTVIVLEGKATIIEDQRLRGYYWRDRWGSFTDRKGYLLVALEVTDARVVPASSGEVVRISRNSDGEWSRM